ncbi:MULTISPECIES: hypothetical protein [Haloferax]|uniref:Uncharacterized protein n=1 Tax=Haloferax mediterranei (strain ATCC 33500 / DSM 1411 / JCM 8866 / NBRC 14739 / NCIMB 2177 / R-4) TaxID=523841 RepID=M0J545_HALMT|nr:hypothetical protein [Haloferax mediterranei]EMA03468.1 hypothetical protein C439_05700 [Haloferax mediterranei ATCC 33500]MDX5988768.1 hypothetical protein [Haloferax mediterranei ATCC 33500]
MQGDESRVDETPLRIELCPETGRIRVHRTTELGTFTRTIDR